MVEYANIVDLDEVAQNEPPHLDLHCFPSSLNSQYDIVWTQYFVKIYGRKFCCLLIGSERVNPKSFTNLHLQNFKKFHSSCIILRIQRPEADSVDPDEMAHNELGAQVDLWVEYWPADLADRIRSPPEAKSSQP